jgi:hypothetical protein
MSKMLRSGPKKWPLVKSDLWRDGQFDVSIATGKGNHIGLMGEDGKRPKITK